MSRTKEAMMEDDGFVTVHCAGMKPSRTGTCIDYPSAPVMAGCSSPYDRDDEPDPDPPAPCKNWSQAVYELVADAEHPLGCARNRDDYDCTCGMAERLMDGHCEECGTDLTSEHGPKFPYSCPECNAV